MNTPVPHKDSFWGKLRVRVSFLLLSILIHYVFLLVLFLFSPKISRKQLDRYFDQNAIRVVNLASNAGTAKPAKVVDSKPLASPRRFTASLSKMKSVPHVRPTLPPMPVNNEPLISFGQKEVAVAEIVPGRERNGPKKVSYMLVSKADGTHRITKLEPFIEDSPQPRKQLARRPPALDVHSRPSIKDGVKPLVEIQTITEGQRTAISGREQEVVIKSVNGPLEPLDYYRKQSQGVEIASGLVDRGVRERVLEYEGRSGGFKPVAVSRVEVSAGGNVKEPEKRKLERRSGWWRGVVERVGEAEPVEVVDSLGRRGVAVGGEVDDVGVIRGRLALSDDSLELDKGGVEIASVSGRRGVRERALEYEGRSGGFKPVAVSRVEVSAGGNVKEPEKRKLERRSGWWRGVVERVGEAEPVEVVDSLGRRGVAVGGEVADAGVIRGRLSLSDDSLELDKGGVEIASVSGRRGVRERALEYERRSSGFKPVDVSRVEVRPKGQLKGVEKRRLEKYPGWDLEVDLEVPEQAKEAGPAVDSLGRRDVAVGGEVADAEVIRGRLVLSDDSLELDKGGVEIASGLVDRGVRERALEYERRSAGVKPVAVSRVGTGYHISHAEVDKKRLHKPQLITETATADYVSKSTVPQMVKVVKQKFEVHPRVKTSFALSADKLTVSDSPVHQKGKVFTAGKGIAKTARRFKREMGGRPYSDRMLGQKRSELVKVLFDKGFKLYSSQLADILQHNLTLNDLATEETDIKMELNLPPGNKTSHQLYQLTGFIDSDVRTAFLTVNDITRLLQLSNGAFKAEVALREGVNGLSLIAINSRGKKSTKSFQIIFVPPLGGVPRISLDSPRNGMQGVREGDQLIVEGTISDLTITQAILLVNKVPIELEVRNGHFKKQIFLPKGRVITFRVMAKNKNGVLGYSPLHTALSAHETEVDNPRPF
jgi:hypothetical protein